MAQDIHLQRDNNSKSLEQKKKDADANHNDYQPIRITVPFTKVLSEFMNNPNTEYSGADICRKTGIKSGTVYPMLLKMAENGWLKDEWENVNPKEVGRPRRRMYIITEKGYIQGRKTLARHFPNLVDSLEPALNRSSAT